MDLSTALLFLNGETKYEHQEKKIKQWQNVYYGMSLHTTGACPKFRSLNGNGEICPPNYFGDEYQWRFVNLLMSRHPREHQVTQNWRFSQYRPMTQAPFQQIIEITIGAIFQDSNYGIDIENEEDNKYIWSNSFEGYDMIGWFANVGIPNIMEDPNGFIIRMPIRPYYETGNNKVEIGLYFINTKDILFYNGNVIIFKKDGYAYYIDDRIIFRYSKVEGRWGIAAEDANGYYAHMFGRLPIDVAGGVWNTQGFYDSYLNKAKPTADDYISSYSAEQMVDKEAAHPFIIQANEECTECSGIGQISEQCDECEGGWDRITCPTCKGKKTISVSPGDRLTADKKDMEYDLVKIVNPDVAINTYHHDKNKDIYDNILHALNLYKTDKAESGEAKAIDQERLYQFFSKISNHLFDKVIYNTISEITAYRNVGVINGIMRPVNTPFTVIKPTQFQIETAADLLAEFKTGTESKMPGYMRGKALTDYVEKRYSGDNIMKRKNEIIQGVDDLALKTDEEISTGLTFNLFSKEDVMLNRKLPMILDSMLRDKGEKWFLDQPFDVIKKEIEARFVIYKPTPTIDILSDLA
jgi:hypothetical protein